MLHQKGAAGSAFYMKNQLLRSRPRLTPGRRGRTFTAASGGLLACRCVSLACWRGSMSSLLLIGRQGGSGEIKKLNRLLNPSSGARHPHRETALGAQEPSAAVIARRG